jgi:hypothetical protein
MGAIYLDLPEELLLQLAEESVGFFEQDSETVHISNFILVVLN